MDLLDISSAVIWVDFFTILLSKNFNLGNSLKVWYDKFGIVAVLSDCLVIILGILIAKFLFPSADLVTLVLVSVLIQIIHDVLFYLFIIQKLPLGQNSVIDLFKEYAAENSWKILVADSIMMASSVLLADYLSTLKSQYVSFIGLLGVYSMTYIIYTK
jgi:uncharacterized protein YacL